MGDFPLAPRGYQRRDVDAFIARLDGTLGRGPLTGPPATSSEVRSVRFPIVFRGYREQPVDDALTAYEAELGVREGIMPAAANAGLRGRPRHAEIDKITAFIATSTFKTVRVGVGYVEREVDAFLDQVISSLRDRDTDPIGAGDVQAVRFATTRWHTGYRETDVDRFLDRLAARLARLGRP
jgi:DivIVA domain-containing protein